MISVDRDIVVEHADLIAEHREIYRLSRELSRLVGGERHGADRARDVLCTLATVVAAHLRREESFVYPGLTRGAATGEAGPLVAAFETLKTDWERYVDYWQQEDVLSDWPTFAAETLRAVKTLCDRALAEVDSLYAIGVREGLVRLHGDAVRG